MLRLAISLLSTGLILWGAFERTPQELLDKAKASKLEPERGAVVLEESTRIEFDAQGRTQRRVHLIYYIRNADGVESNDSLSVSYTPWYQSKPLVKARVIDAAGKVHPLDPTTLNDAPALEYDTDIYSDRRVLSAPLPAIAAGVVVEYEYVVEDKQQFFAAGTSHFVGLSNSAPSHRITLEVTAPVGLPLLTKSALLPEGALVVSEAKGMRTWKVVLDPAPKTRRILPLLPSNVATNPFFGVTTGKSWQSVATAYQKVVEEQVANADLASLGPLLPPETAREKVIDTWVRRIHEKVRYVGIELGDGSLVPRKPGETLKRQYGDCKDKAALLVAALRAQGIRAHVALLQAGSGTDVERELPGLGEFNHAIAYVPGEKPLWIDVTAENFRVGALPEGDQGRLALVADAGTTELLKIPVAAMDDNWLRYTRQVTMQDGKPARFSEVIESGGANEAELRAVFAGEVTKGTKDALASYAKGTLLTKEQEVVAMPAKHDFSKPYEFRWKSDAAGRFVVERAGGVVVILPSPLVTDLPQWFQDKPEKDEKADEATREWQKRNEDRKEPFVLPRAYRAEYVYEVKLPPHFKLKTMPRGGTQTWGPAKYTRQFRNREDGVFEAKVRFEIPKTELTVAEATALRDGVVGMLGEKPIVVEILHQSEELLALGESRKALDELRAAVKEDPKAAMQRFRMARAYLQVGLGNLARKAVMEGVELEPKSASSWHEAAFVFQHDGFGRHFGRGWDRAKTIEYLKKSLELEESAVVRADLAITYEHDESGERYGSRKALDEAIAVYEALGPKLATSGVEQNYTICLMLANRWEDMEQAAQKLANKGLGRLFTLLARGAIDGAGPTILAVQNEVRDPNQRMQTLASISASYVQARQYALGAEFLKPILRMSSSPALQKRVEMLSAALRAEETKAKTDTPEAAYRSLMQHVFSGKFEPASLRPLMYDKKNFDREMSQDAQRMRQLDDEISTMLDSVMAQTKGMGVTRAVMRDLILAGVKFESSGDDQNGFRVTAKLEGGEDDSVYVMKEGDAYLVGAADDDLSSFRSIVLKMLADGKLKAAQTWIDWVAEDIKPTEAGDELSTPPIRYLWSGINQESRHAEAAKVAVHTLKSDFAEDNRESAKVLEQALLKAKIGRDKAHLLYAITLQLKAAGDSAPMLAAARRLVAAAPKSGVAFSLLQEALRASGQLAEAETLANARLKATAKTFTSNVEMEDEKALLALMQIELARKNYKAAATYGDRLAKQRNHNEEIKTKALWVRTLAGLTENAPFEMAEPEDKARITKESADVLLARAFSLLKAGNPGMAQGRLQRYIDASVYPQTRPAFVQVWAEMARAMGEVEEATRIAATAETPRRGVTNLLDELAISAKQ